MNYIIIHLYSNNISRLSKILSNLIVNDDDS